MEPKSLVWLIAGIGLVVIMGLFYLKMEEKQTIALKKEFDELNRDSGDVKRRLTWAKKREKKTLKKVSKKNARSK